MNNTTSDQMTERPMSAAKKQNEFADALLCSKGEKRTLNESQSQEEPFCINKRGALGADQTTAVANNGLVQIADEYPLVDLFEGSEHSSTSDSDGGNTSAIDSDGSTREVSPDIEDPRSLESYRNAAAKGHRPLFQDTFDGVKASPVSACSVLSMNEIDDLNDSDSSSEETILNDGLSSSVNSQGLAILDLPTDRPRALQNSADEDQWPIRLSGLLTQSLKDLAKEHGAGLSEILLAAWSAVLSRLSGQQEYRIAIHGLALSRQVKAADSPAYSSLHLDLSSDPTTVQLLEYVKRTALEYGEHQLNNEQVAFSYNREEGPSALGLGPSSPRAAIVGFELELNLKDEDDWIVGVMCYATALFDSLTIERYVGYLNLMLEGMVSDATQLVSKINIISPAERTLLLETWNKTPPLYQEFQTIHQLFEEQVKRTPTATALVQEGQELTYSELNERSNSLAHHLIELGVNLEDFVAICVERSPAMIVAILAVLKAGGAYVPLDPSYPSERLKSILEDAAPAVMITDNAGRAVFGETTLNSLTLVDPNTILAYPTMNPEVQGLTSRHLAYIIYTSGSTGKPKGVMVEHCGVVNLAQTQSQVYGVSESSRILQLTSICFDSSVWDIVLALSTGATLYILPEAIRTDRDKTWSYMHKHSINLVGLTPSFLQDGKDLPHVIESLTLGLGGEALSPVLLEALTSQGITVINDYGPTETTVSTTSWRCPVEYKGDIVPIGRPVLHSRLYVLDAHRQPLPLGVTGELYIGGVAVARGYLNRPELTSELFLPDPFSEIEGARMYRTGDLGRYLPDGNLVHLGRIDDQVKIRGFRIELGEIESCLLEHEWVSEAVVLAVDAGDDKKLVAYVVAKSGLEIARHLRAHIAAKLPQYMVPVAFVHMEIMPLTPNDKLDRKALPAPDEEAFARETYEAPRGNIENKLAAIWAELLPVKHISRNDNFFALGGHSLLAARMLHHIKRLGLTVSVQTLFKFPTLSALAQELREHQVSTVPPNLITSKTTSLTPEILPLIELTQSDIDYIVKCVPGGVSNIQDIYPLSPLQDGILFHHLLATKGDPYLLTSTMAFESRELLDRYLDAFQKVVDRHDILRTAILWEGLSTPAQVVCRSAPLPVLELTLDPADGPIREQLDRRFSPKHYRIDLTQAPLLQFIAAKDANEQWLLVQLLHHLTGDHDSAEEMNIEIKAFMDGLDDSLQPPRPFRELIAQSRLKSSHEVDERFFKEMLEDVDEPTLPFGLTAVYNGGTEVTESHQLLPQSLNTRLRIQAKKLGVGLATLCHVAWAQVLARTSGQQRVVFGTVLFGRMQADGGSENTSLGLSINTLPFRCDIDERGVRECIQDTHSRLIALLEYEHVSLAMAQQCSSVPAGTSLFSGLLNYRHTSLPSNGSTSGTEFVSEEERFQYPGVELLSSQERTNYPLSLSVEDFGTALGLTVQVMHPVDPARVCRYVRQAMESLVEALEATSDVSIRQLETLPVEECQMLLQEWSGTQEDYPTDLCLHHLFEQQVERTPEAIALVYENQSLTYAEVNTRANNLAHRLIDLGVRPDVLVAICVERSPAAIVGILAILKAGGAYVPLDPFYTSDRLRDILHDSAPACVVADKVGRTAIGETSLSTLTVLDPNIIATPTSNPSIPTLTPHHLVYVIYTSGTTGKPKGVMIEHHGAVNAVICQHKHLQVQPSSRMTQFFSIGFDPSVLEIFSTLCYGGSLYLLQDSIRLDRHQLWNYLEQHHITHVIFIPSMLQDCGELSPLSSLTKILLGGEPLTATLARKVQAIAPNSTIINEYGPTETTVAALTWKYSETGLDDIVPIGRPLANERLYLLDAHKNPVPLGILGEIYIGGVGVARGYLNRPELTAKNFMPDPFSSEPGARMYKTGDTGRYLPDGNIVCLGRNDHQVKIRGFRIELGEIEARLSEHALVSETVVIVQGEGSNKRLIAYVIASTDHQDIQASSESQLSLALRSYLLGRLPEYMVPAVFVRMDAFPLTPNGKLDRRALPTPNDRDFVHQIYEAPQNEIENALAAIWSELLGVERVGRHDGFFTLGGHSLLAVRLMNRVATLGAHIPLSTLFASSSLSTFAAVVREQLAQGQTAPPKITPISRDDVIPLSFAQQRLWFLSQLEGVSDTYHMPLAVRMDGILNQPAWKQSIDDLYSRHEALRSVFVNPNGQPEVRILPRGAMPLRYIDLRGTSDAETELRQLCDEEARTSFDLAQGPLVRAMLIQLADAKHVFLMTQHHIVSDGWSLAIIQRELGLLYTAYCNGESGALPPLTIQYSDYAVWQRQWLSGDRLKEQGDYWRTTLSNAPVLLDLPTDRPRPPQQSFKGSQVQIAFDAGLTSALKRLSHQHGVTLFMTILTAWSVVLSRLCNQDDIIIGTPSANRSQQEIESLIGFFVNTLALRVDLSGEPSTLDLLQRVRRSTLAAYAHQDLPFEQVVEIVQPPRRMDCTPLFQVMFVWQNNEHGEWNLPGLQVTDHDLDNNFAKFDLALNLWESDGGITGNLGYALSLFDRGTIERYISNLSVVLQQMVSDPDQPILAVDILSPNERTLLLETWNETLKPYPTDLCLHHLFEQQVERTPEAIALVYENQSLTYAEVNTRANNLAHRLIDLGVRPDVLVAICVERSPAAIVGILAILKAGGAYVPLDPFYTSDRLRDILHDSAPACVVADKVGRTAIGETALSTLTVLDPNIIATPTSNPSIPTLTPHHLVYVIYTSGTTGKPKGVMIEHQGVVNAIVCRQVDLQFQPSSRMIQFFSISFDPSVFEIFGTLCFGGSLHLLHENVRLDRHRLWGYLEQHYITHAFFIPSMLQDCGELSPLSTLTKIVLGGEPLTTALARKVQAIAPNSTIINEYGPTETTVAALTWKYSETGLDDIVPIGRPLANKRVYLLDAHKNPVPLGILGEIYIGGVGVARGYLNRPELTAKNFMPDPFSSEPGARMYKSGDTGRYLPDGNIVCLGRNDHQVKIRGFRIELGEIEARLSEHALVSETVVIVQGEGSNKRLIAYVIASTDHQDIQASSESQLSLALRSYLLGRLPEYMVPAVFVRMDAFPLTPNGKLDRRALPTPNDRDFVHQIYEAPQNEIENALAAIWSELLGVERVGRHDGFFTLGGHSLLAVRLMNRVATLGAHIPLSTLFASSSLSTFAAVVREQLAQGQTAPPKITPISRDDVIPLSFAQQRLWFLSQLEGVSDTYHMPLAVRMDGILNQPAWKQSIDDLYSRHEALRSVFVNPNGQPEVRILPRGAMPLRYIDLRGTSDAETELRQLCDEEARTSFDLAQGPLVRAMLIQLADAKHVFLMTQHHIVSDGWSLAIIQRELGLLYTAYCNGESGALPPLTIQYSDYAVWQRQWLSGDRLKEQGDYWRTTLSNAPVLLDLPTDRPRPPQQSFKGSQVQIAFDAGLTSALKRLSHQHGVTLFMTILTAWSVVLSRLCNQDDIIIGTPSANRSQQEIESLIGFFVNTLALRVDLSGEPSTLDLLQRVRRSTLAAYAHQDLPFEQVVEIVQPPRRMDCTPLFQVMFVWQNNEHGEWNLPGLQVTDHDLDNNFAKFDLALNLWESDGGITGNLGYALSLFDRGTIERYISNLSVVLQQMVSDPDQPILAVDILSPNERTLLLETWNETLKPYPTDLCLHHLFEQQVERTPEAIALVYENQSLTYAEVNTRANNLAHRLIDLGVRPDVLVAICVERSPAAIVGILAILKAGGAYVPLDPFYTSDRLRDILHDSAPACVVADKVGRTAIGETALSTLTVLDPNIIATPTSNPSIPTLTPHHLVYVIYTSGTTGKPKGVMIEHQGVVNAIVCRQVDLQFQPSSRMIQFFSISFDPSVFEIFGTLCFGGSLHLLHENVRLDRHRLWGYLEQHYITHAFFIPSMLQDCGELSPLSTLTKIVLGGEPLTTALARKVQAIAPNSTIINEYGPTETTVAALTWKYSETGLDDIVPIGRPLANKRVYLLDAHKNPVPLGILGEIYIGGVGVARGYLNRPELTAKNFMPDPFSSEPGARMYKTGDTGRYLPDGNIVCLGRNDHQVKIRGFRIELGEIEARLSEHALVSETVVIVQGEGSNKRLIAYVIASTDHQDIQASSESQLSLALRSYLLGRLPEYMVPAVFVRMDAFPLTLNGKLDRRALPSPGDDDFARQNYESPRGEIDCVLSSIWLNLLNVDKIGRHDNFFNLGGHSLLAVRMITQVRKMLGFDLTLRTLFEFPTIAELAPRLLATGVTQEDSFDVLLPIKPQGNRLPLFCIHPGTGISWCYTGFATRVHPDQPVYGLQARGFISGQEMALNLNEMVLDYISQVRRIQPHGPYQLLGYSFGGLVAHTMAVYLEEQGEKVAFVAMMDTHADYHSREVRKVGGDMQLPDVIYCLLGNKEMYSPDLINPFLEKAPAIFSNNSRIGRLQAPGVFNGDLLIFRATMSPARLIAPEDWKPYALGSIEICDIESVHDFMDMPEPMTEISRILSYKLDESHSRQYSEESRVRRVDLVGQSEE